MRQSEQKGYTPEAASLLQNKVRTSTQSTYNSSWRHWQQYAEQHRIDAGSPAQAEVVNFMGHMFKEGADYSKLNSIRSAMASAIPSLTHMEDVHSALQAAHKQRPPRAKHDDDMWDPALIVQMWRMDKDNEDLKEERLRQKALSLYMLSSHSRPSDTASIATSTIRIDERRMQYRQHPGKVWRPGQGNMVRRDPIERYEAEPKICPVKAIEAYLDVTKDKRQVAADKLWLASRRETKQGRYGYHTLAPPSVSRVMLQVMQEAGINTDEYKGGSARAASSTAALEAGARVEAVMKRGNWSSMTVFNQFYNRAQRSGVTAAVLAGRSQTTQAQ
jgi:hypothetical protein